MNAVRHAELPTRPKVRPAATLDLPKLYPKQREAIYDPARYVFIESSTKAGKTSGCIVWLLELAWTKGKSGRNYWWVAPVADQANIAFKRMRLGLEVTGAVPHLQNKTITLPNGASIWFKSADRPDSLYGEDVYAAVIDEGSRTKEDVWAAIRTTLTATRGPVRIIGNVKGRKNWAYKLARKAQAGAQDMAYHKITAWDAVDAGILERDEVEDAQRTLPPHIFRELYLAEPADGGGNPFGIREIQRCIAPLSVAAPVAWGVDLAKSHDWTVAIGLDAVGAVCRFERWQAPWSVTIHKLSALLGNIYGLVDSTGVGDPIVEQLQKRCQTVEGFHFSAQSKQQLMEGLASAISQLTIRYPEGPISNELNEFEYEYSRTGVKYSAPPGSFDDCVCALALALRAKSSRPATTCTVAGIIKRAVA